MHTQSFRLYTLCLGIVRLLRHAPEFVGEAISRFPDIRKFFDKLEDLVKLPYDGELVRRFEEGGEFLMIGGSHNGERMRMPEGRYYVRMEKARAKPLRFPNVMRDDRPSVEIEHYQAHVFTAGDQEFLIYVLDGLDIQSAFAQLIDNYRPR